MNIRQDYDCQSLVTHEESENLNDKNKSKFGYNYEEKEKIKADIPQIKNFPHYFFILFIIVLFVLLFKFVPNFYKFTVDHPKLQAFSDNKFKMKYFSTFLPELDIFSKIIFLSSHLILYAIILSIKSCVDMKKSKKIDSFADSGKYMTNALILISFLTLFILMFTPEYIDVMFKNYSDNPLFIFYLFSHYALELQIHFNLSKIKNCLFSDNYVFRFGCLILNSIQLILYSSSIIVLNFIPGIDQAQRLMIFILIICINVNSIMFISTFMFFILSLKNELEPIKLELKLNYPEEYFIDLDINNKNIL